MAATIVFRTWPFAFGHVRLMKFLDPPVPEGPVRRRLRSFPLELEFEADSYLGRYLFYRGMYEEATIDRLRSLLTGKMTFVDVGAYVGLYSTIGAHLVGPNGRVLAIEPQKELRAQLARNVARNNLSNVLVLDCALGYASRTAVLHQISRDNPGLATLTPGETERSIGGEAVEVRALDDVLKAAEINSVDGIKIDVEGAELDVLLGGEKLFTQKPPHFIIVECIDHHLGRFGASSQALMTWLEERGYEMRVYNRGRWIPTSPTPQFRGDLLAIRRDRTTPTRKGHFPAL